MRASLREHAAPSRLEPRRVAASLLTAGLVIGAAAATALAVGWAGPGMARADEAKGTPANAGAPAAPTGTVAPSTAPAPAPAVAKVTTPTVAKSTTAAANHTTPAAKSPAPAAKGPAPVTAAKGAVPPAAKSPAATASHATPAAKSPVPLAQGPAPVAKSPVTAAKSPAPATATKGVPAKPVRTTSAARPGVNAAPASAAPSAVAPARPPLNTPMLQPAPALEERVIYQYNALGRRDPFIPMVGGTFVGDDVGGDAAPDVGGIKVVGIVWGADDKFALIEDARGSSGVLRAGDKVMNGVVETLRRDAVVVKLTVDGQTETVAIPLTRKGDQTNANR